MHLRLALLFLVIAATCLRAQSWRSALYPENGYDPSSANLETDKVLQDFSYAGYRRGEFPIPNPAGPVFDVTSAPYSADSTGVADATAAIQAAIDAAGAAGGGVVRLPAGTYRLSVADDRTEALFLNKPGVVLRGAGIGQTRLLNTTTADMKDKAVIRVRGPTNTRFWTSSTNQVLLSQDLLRSTRVIPVVSTAPFAVGDTVLVRNDITAAWITEHKFTDWTNNAADLRGLTYRRTIAAIDPVAGTLTIDAPIRYALKVRDNARVVRLAQAPLAEIGLEDFSFANVQHPGTRWLEDDWNIAGTPGYAVEGCFFFSIENTRDCWMRRLASYQPSGNTSTAHVLSGGISVRDSTHVTIEDCAIQRPQYGGGGGNGYMFLLVHVGECLIQRSEARFSRHGYSLSGFGVSGNVIHNSIDIDTGRATGNTGSYVTTGMSSDHHMQFSQANLIDLCTAQNSWFEARYRGDSGTVPHSVTAVHSVYWNTRGTGNSTQPVVKSEQARYGYVIGTRGTRTTVERPRAAAAATDPIDHLEGAGAGDTLIPQSLFLDQRARRLAPDVALPTPAPLPFPANRADITPLGFTVQGVPVSASSLQISWEAADPRVSLAALPGGGVRAQVPGPGSWELTCVVTSNGNSRRRSLQLVASPAASTVTRSLTASADTTVDGAVPDTNYGTAAFIRMKTASTSTGIRHALLRFDLSALSGDIPLSARLVLTQQRPLTIYPGWQIALRAIAATPAWTEAGTTWSNAPALGATLTTFAPSTSGVDTVDFSAPTLAATDAGASTLEFALAVLEQPDSTLHYYHSREYSDASMRPRLEVDVVPAAARFEVWIASRAGVPAEARAATADPDGDGLSNLLEMFLARDPAQADPSPPLNLANGRLKVVLADPAPFGGALVVERSHDLVTWTPLPILEADIRTLPDGRRELDLAAAIDAPRTFWRIRADAP